MRDVGERGKSYGGDVGALFERFRMRNIKGHQRASKGNEGTRGDCIALVRRKQRFT